MTVSKAREILETLCADDDVAGGFPVSIEFYDPDIPDGKQVLLAIRTLLNVIREGEA